MRPTADESRLEGSAIANMKYNAEKKNAILKRGMSKIDDEERATGRKGFAPFEGITKKVVGNE